MHVDLRYARGVEKITLVSKDVEMNNNSFKGSILEVIPKDISDSAEDIEFITDASVLKSDPIFEMSIENIENSDGKIVYYIRELIPVKIIEDTETLLFQEYAVSSSSGNIFSITGFATIFDSIDLGGSIFYSLLASLLLLAIVFMSRYVITTIRVRKWKEEEDVRRLLSKLKSIKNALLQEDLDQAREDYNSMKELYQLVPEGFRKYVYKDIKKARTDIDKKDILSMLREFDSARRENRLEDAQNLYTKIQLTYKRLPKKYRERVYRKLQGFIRKIKGPNRNDSDLEDDF
jgi:hypothetical protein